MNQKFEDFNSKFDKTNYDLQDLRRSAENRLSYLEGRFDGLSDWLRIWVDKVEKILEEKRCTKKTD